MRSWTADDLTSQRLSTRPPSQSFSMPEPRAGASASHCAVIVVSLTLSDPMRAQCIMGFIVADAVILRGLLVLSNP